jgi:hypothetical protein
MAGSYLVVVGDLTGGTGTYAVAVTDPEGNTAPGSFVIDFQGPPPTGPQPPPPSVGSPPPNFSPFDVMGVPPDNVGFFTFG